MSGSFCYLIQMYFFLFLLVSCYFFFRWCSIMMELLGAWTVFFSSLFVVLQRDSLSSGQAGLSVSYALQVNYFVLGFHITIVVGQFTHKILSLLSLFWIG